MPCVQVELREGYDKIIDNTESAYDSIMQQSHSLLETLNATTDAMARFNDDNGSRLYNTYSDASALV
jgi:hypothetical protein